MVKDEMGSDAVILHTKRYRQGGFLGYRSKEVVEVTAAIEDAPRRPKVKIPPMPREDAPLRPSRRAASARPVAPIAQAPRQVLAQYKTAGTAEGVSMARSSAELSERLQQAPMESAPYMGTDSSFVPMEPRSMDPIGAVQPIRQVKRTVPVQPSPQMTEMPPVSQPAAQYTPQSYIPEDSYSSAKQLYHEAERNAELRRAPQMQQPAYTEEIQPQTRPVYEQPIIQMPSDKTAPEPRVVKAEPEAVPVKEPVSQPEAKAADNGEEKIQALEDELAQMRLMLKQVMGQSKTENERITLQDALKAQAVNEQVMQDVIRKISPATLLAPKDSEESQKALSDYLHATLKTGDGIGLKDGRPKIVALIGTTGVGKTTTIAKIAARFVLERGISVALITADTYRISAVDQLKTYSDIIGLPLEIVYSAAELKPALRKHKGKQLILIDTAGRSQNNDYQMEELKEFLSVDPSIEKHLVMSATTKERDAEAIMDRFSICKPDRVIFTKTDETDSLGFVVNLLYDRRIALSYLTNGQSVPDDIEPARPEALAKLLLR